MNTAWWDQFNRYCAQKFFSKSLRIDLYRAIGLLLSNQVQLNDALLALHKIYSDEGKQPQNPAAMLLKDCLYEMSTGKPFSEGLSGWIPVDEAMILQAGEAAGRLSEAFQEAEQLIAARSQIKGAVMGALTYPVFLFGMTGFLLHLVATDLVPKLAKVVDPSRWKGSAAILYNLSYAVNQYGVAFIFFIAFLVVLITASLGYFVGKWRVFLDKIPPWSIYRMILGATFLMNVSALIKSGIQLNLALDKLIKSSNRYLRTRIEAARFELSLGKNFGEALIDSGYDFPDKRANLFLSIISSYSGLDKALSSFGKQWLEETVIKIQQASKLILAVGIMLVGCTMLVVIAGAGGLQDALQSATGA